MVDVAQVNSDGDRDVRVLTAPQFVGICPACGVRSTRSKGWVMTRPRDVKVGPGIPNLLWCKQKWVCRNPGCGRKQFTDSVPQVPARARFTVRCRLEMATAVLDNLRTVDEVARSFGASWNTCCKAVTVMADAVLGVPPGPVRVLGLDETRRGKAKWEVDPVTGVRRWVDLFDTGMVDISGDQGLLGQVNGREAATVVAWLDEQGEAFKAGITHVAIDMSSSYAKAVREALPHAQIVVDRFHLVRLANEKVDEVRRRITQEQRGRRGRRHDPEWVSRRRMQRGKERLTAEQTQVLLDKMNGADHGRGDLLAMWIGKELLRDVLACKDTRATSGQIWNRLATFYTFVAACSVRELRSLAHTVDHWQGPIIAAIQTGLSNAGSEGTNRIVKHVGRIAFGFRNRANQHRRVRWACTRRQRRAPSKVKQLRPC